MSLILKHRVKSLWAVLHDLDYVPKEGLNVHQKGEMDAIVQKGREVLLEIDSKLSKHNVLAFSTSNWKTKALRAWSRVTWDPAEFSTLRDRITSCISLTNLVMGKINQFVIPPYFFYWIPRYTGRNLSLTIHSGI
jgi:hypothetical protein